LRGDEKVDVDKKECGRDERSRWVRGLAPRRRCRKESGEVGCRGTGAGEQARLE
jgi:hypothetical protein